MSDPEIHRLLASTGAGQGPPLGIDASGIIRRGHLVRRKRKRFAVLGSAVATGGAVITIAALLAAGRPPEPLPVQPAVPAPMMTSSVPRPLATTEHESPPNGPSPVTSTAVGTTTVPQTR
ncbi:hypothetical protein FNH05_30140 [Amycolatopsis rhizosphaerae]|uniref:Uncharacterized protein n=1 Tax=Amycolatopsis rhizosphaerae TaxID=2053003 RepID=A0A558AWC9_9PSEU|nr:hypothetical protein [Amycolatopsis rhizosphaerae]TVT28541.1 hypothetical protein FNH05_30140 [Amycolatopsis rhizosphaerae]